MKFTTRVYQALGGAHALFVGVPEFYWSSMRVMLDRSAKKHSEYLTLCVDLPKKPRTIGPKSQSHHLRGHEGQIADFTGHLPSEIHDAVKWETPTWPVKSIRGHDVKISEADISTIVCADAITTCHRIAADFGIRLIESEDEQ